MNILPLLLVSILLWTALPAAGVDADAPPTHAPGDAWSYEGTWSPPGGGSKTPTSVEREIVDQETITIPSGTYDALRWVERFTMGSGDEETTTTGYTWTRLSDGALLRKETTAERPDGTWRQETVYDRPCRLDRYPLEVGDAWTSRCPSTWTTSDGGEEERIQRVETHVLREAHVSVPAGTFETLVLERTEEDGEVRTEWYAPAACGPVKTRLEVGNSVMELASTSITCQTSHDPAGSPNEQELEDEGSTGTEPRSTAPIPGPGVGIVAGLLALVAGQRKERGGNPHRSPRLPDTR